MKNPLSLWTALFLVAMGCTTPETTPTSDTGGSDGGDVTDDAGDGVDSATDDASSDTESWTVDHYRRPCVGEAANLCLRVRKGEGADWQNFHDSIGGFDYQWGRRYELLIEVEEIDDPPAGGSSLEYTLVEEVSVSEVDPGTTFTWTVPSLAGGQAPYLTVNGTTGTLLDGKMFRCEPATTCDDITTLLSGDAAFEITFEYGADVDGRLIATSATESS